MGGGASAVKKGGFQEGWGGSEAEGWCVCLCARTYVHVCVCVGEQELWEGAATDTST